MADNKKQEVSVFEPVDKEKVKTQIYEFRGMRVMLDSDIAAYFGVETGALNRAMKRNIKRFPSNFCFQLTDDEISRCQSGISMQTTGIKGGRAYKPYVYSEQGVAMLTSCLHTDRAISASIQIMEAFVELTHLVRQNQYLISGTDIKLLESRTFQLDERLQNVENNMITRADLNDLIRLFDSSTEAEEILILDSQPFKADVAYQKIYKKAKKSIIVIDDYIGVKTLQHLATAKKTVDITIISDNKSRPPLRQSEYEDFKTENSDREITFIKTDGRTHDRFIVLDNGSKDMKVFFCGSSSKDSGKRITTIIQATSISEYKPLLKSLMENPTLNLK